MTTTKLFPEVVTMGKGHTALFILSKKIFIKKIIKSICITASRSLSLQTSLRNWHPKHQGLYLINHI